MLGTFLAAMAALGWGHILSQSPSPMATTQPPAHVLVQPDAIVWRGQAGGLQTAIAEGNPQTAGSFTMLLKLPDGVWIPPHFHNVDKRLVVIKGELLMGHGDSIALSKATALKTGGIAVVPAGTHHYEGGRGETIVALVAAGPFTTTMVKGGGTAR
jgi:mannose-6-phosphate isomerase-like protein (cupin superfamily)